MTVDIGKCDVCGNSATSACVDAQRVPQKPGEEWESFVPFGGMRRGCSLHPVVSRTFDVNGEQVHDL